MEFKNWLVFNESDINSVVNKLPDFYSGNLPDVMMKNIVYSYLTQHGNREDSIKNTLQSDPNKYLQYNKTYKDTINAVINHLKPLNWIAVSDGGAWIEWYRKGNHKGVKTNNKTSKRYISINHNDLWDILQSLPVLARNLENVQVAPESDVIGFKIPTNLGTFFTHKDNIVIHYYDANAQQQIESAVKNFFSQINKKEMDRSEFNRVNTGKDANGTSDSDLVANQIIRNLKANEKAIKVYFNNPDNLKTVVKNMIDNISMQASHRN